jgi:hypothetical protein
MNSPDHISESLETIFGLKYFDSLMRIRDPVRKKFASGTRIRNTAANYSGAVDL